MIELNHFNVFCLLAILSVNAHGMSVIVMDDVVISIDELQWRCDRIFCPVGTEFCEVEKYTKMGSSNILHRRNTCYSLNDEILLQNKTEEVVPPNVNYHLQIQTDRHGSTATSGNGGFYQSSSTTLDEIPNVNIPNINIPNIEIPNIEIPEIEIGEVVMPKIPDIRVPPIKIPKIEIPNVAIPNIEIPNVEIPDIEIPNIEIPNIEIPNIEIPNIQYPEIRFPKKFNVRYNS